MKAVVVYKSKSGFARKYAEWIAAELPADLVEGSKASASVFAGYDAVVYGGGLYAAGINGVKFITSNLDKLEGKRVAVFATGATPPREEALEEIINRNFTADQLAKLKFFYLRGGFDYGRLKPADKVLMTMLKAKIRLRRLMERKLHPDETGMLAAYGKPIDVTNRKNIAPLVEYIRGGGAG